MRGACWVGGPAIWYVHFVQSIGRWLPLTFLKFRKKPIVIEAIQWQGDNLGQVLAFTAGRGAPYITFEEGQLLVNTREGTMRADKDDWIIRGVKGEFYPCKPDIFAETYDIVKEE